MTLKNVQEMSELENSTGNMPPLIIFTSGIVTMIIIIICRGYTQLLRSLFVLSAFFLHFCQFTANSSHLCVENSEGGSEKPAMWGWCDAATVAACHICRDTISFDFSPYPNHNTSLFIPIFMCLAGIKSTKSAKKKKKEKIQQNLGITETVASETEKGK